MAILTLKDASLAFGHHPILSHADLAINAGDKICLVGRNGAGKSTLFRILLQEVQLDEGELWCRDGLKISYLPQDVPEENTSSVFKTVASGLGELGDVLSRYHAMAHELDQVEDETSADLLDEFSDLQHKIEVADGWNLNQKVETVISKLALPTDARFSDCSGGIRRRVLLAKALVSEPDLLLLDEPTNHMDIEAILWLETFLRAYTGALIFITHDRVFLKNLANSFIELDRGKLSFFSGNFDYYMRKKQEMIEVELREMAQFDKKLAEEETWIRKGIKARRTRNEGRVRRLKEMREVRRQRIGHQGKVNLNLNSGEYSGKRVTELKDVSFSYGDKTVIKNLDTCILRGDRIGILGPNGCGKSTLLRLLLGELKPTSGELVKGTRLDIAYFDQQRQTLDLTKTVRQNIADGSDYISVKGRSRHVVGYLKDFLFPPERIDTPIRILSGGERNRLLLAKILANPANLLVLDEPTNDLDVETLELLEDLLGEYEGTLLIVSHDRQFLDNVVTSILIYEGDGKFTEHVGGYDDWSNRIRESQTANSSGSTGKDAEIKQDTKTDNTSAKQKSDRKQKLGYKETMELKQLPEKIERLEEEKAAVEAETATPEFYKKDKNEISARLSRLDEINRELEVAYERWEHLMQY